MSASHGPWQKPSHFQNHHEPSLPAASSSSLLMKNFQASSAPHWKGHWIHWSMVTWRFQGHGRHGISRKSPMMTGENKSWGKKDSVQLVNLTPSSLWFSWGFINQVITTVMALNSYKWDYNERQPQSYELFHLIYNCQLGHNCRLQ